MAARIESQAEPIPGYQLVERLGGGGFGEVWKAIAPGGLHKAIKFVYGDLSAAGDGQRAEQELKALNRVKTVRHPYILSLERIEIIDGQLMIVMELADRSLWDRFRECRAQGMPGIPRDELLGYMEETAEALDLMNGEYNLQHLDIKPQNLFLVYQHVKVADFGLVKDLEGMQASVTGGVTPVYAAPEIFDGTVSRFSDQYSLAIVYQELLTGQRPFSGTNVRHLILQHMQAAPNLSSLPPEDQPVIGRGLAKVSGERFPMCRDMVARLRQNSGAPGAVAPSRHAGAARPPAPQDLEDTPTNPDLPTHMLRPRTDLAPGAARAVSPVDLLAPQAEGAAPPPVPAEVHGDGCLFPALVVGIGQVGMLALQRLRGELHDHFRSPGRVPSLRLLLLDTDPAVMHAATRTRPGTALSAAEVLLAPLNRPSHYLKPRDGKPSVESWLNPRMLYRIPRSQVPSGVRALGRLAFCDNYKLIARRLRLDLEQVLDPETLKRAAEQTGLGVRSNRPRVYLVAGLAGGTGGGMFLDLAYTVRARLKELGYPQPDVVGLFFLPPLEGHGARAMQLGNTFAALTELSHFGTPGTTFEARYLEREGTVTDAEPPFTRTVLMRLPEESDEVASEALLNRTARLLFHELCSPLGRAADLSRAGLPARWETRGLGYQAAGLYQISWPRRDLLRAAARGLCQRLVQGWMSKDGKAVRSAAQTWIEEQMEARELGADRFIRRLDDECAKALGAAPEETFQNALRPLTARLPQSAEKPAAARAGWLKPARAAEVPELPEEAYSVPLECLTQLLGRPGDDATETPCKAVKALREAADLLASEWGQKLSELHVRLIERPGFRLAGAEEGVRHVVAALEKVLQHYEPLLRDLKEKAADAHVRLHALVAAAKNGRKPPPQELLELLKSYPKWRYQSLVMQQVITAFLGLRGHVSDELREVNFCRVRLTELLRLLETEEAASPAAAASAGVQLFPGGCKDLRGAAEAFLGRIDAAALLELDERVQALLKSEFTALVHVCLSNAGVVLRTLDAAMRQTAEDFAAEHLQQTDVAEMLLERHPNPEDVTERLAAAFQDTIPSRVPGGVLAPELCVLAAPSGPAGDRVRACARGAIPDVEMVNGAEDSILLYREMSCLPFDELDHVGPAAREAYQQMCAAENFTPHTRIDVAFRR